MQWFRAGHSKGRALTASGHKPNRWLRYGGASFSAATALPLDGRVTRPRLIGKTHGGGRASASAPLRVNRAPSANTREYVILSESCAGRSLERYFNQRRDGRSVKNRLWRGVLLLPRDHADYLRGRHRHALRNQPPKSCDRWHPVRDHKRHGPRRRRDLRAAAPPMGPFTRSAAAMPRRTISASSSHAGK